VLSNEALGALYGTARHGRDAVVLSVLERRDARKRDIQTAVRFRQQKTGLFNAHGQMAPMEKIPAADDTWKLR
jgi:hypothetical protein